MKFANSLMALLVSGLIGLAVWVSFQVTTVYTDLTHHYLKASNGR